MSTTGSPVSMTRRSHRLDLGRCIRDDLVDGASDVRCGGAAIHCRERFVHPHVAQVAVEHRHSGVGDAEQELGERHADSGSRRRRIKSPAIRRISEWTVHGTRRRVTLQSTNAVPRTQDRDPRAATSFSGSLA